CVPRSMHALFFSSEGYKRSTKWYSSCESTCGMSVSLSLSVLSITFKLSISSACAYCNTLLTTCRVLLQKHYSRFFAAFNRVLVPHRDLNLAYVRLAQKQRAEPRLTDSSADCQRQLVV